MLYLLKDVKAVGEDGGLVGVAPNFIFFEGEDDGEEDIVFPVKYKFIK